MCVTVGAPHGGASPLGQVDAAPEGALARDMVHVDAPGLWRALYLSCRVWRDSHP